MSFHCLTSVVTCSSVSLYTMIVCFFVLIRQQVFLRAVHVRKRGSDLRADGSDGVGSENVSPAPQTWRHVVCFLLSHVRPLFFRWQCLITQCAEAMKAKPQSE